MNQFRTISAILRGQWALEQAAAENMLPMVVSFLKGQGFGAGITAGDYTDDYRKNEEKYYFNKEQKVEVGILVAGAVGYETRYFDGFKDAPHGSIGIIPIQGAMMKNDNCGDAGSMTNARRIIEANRNTNIAGILLRIDSPGGMVDGLATLYDTIAHSAKPVVAFIEDGSAYSAAYYIAAACAEVHASHPTCGVGSIGTFQRLIDYSGYMEKEGIKMVDVYAPQSTLKNENYRAFIEKGDTSGFKAQLAVYAQDFIDHVKEGRGNRLNAGADSPVFKGATFFATEAQQLGLIDGICSMEDALQRVSELAGSNKGGLYV